MIYLAGPYTCVQPHSMVYRHKILTQCAAKLMSEGHVVYSPITHGAAIEPLLPFGQENDHDFWMRQCLPILERCDELLVVKLLGWSTSRGVAREIEHARDMEIPISYAAPGDLISGVVHDS